MTSRSEDHFAGTLAHQLKTPIAALEAAAANLRRNLRAFLEDLRAAACEQGQAAGVARFVAQVIDEPAPPPQTGLLPQDRLEAIQGRLAAERVGGDLGAAASSLLRSGWDTYLEEIVPLLRQDEERTLDLLETASRIRSNLGAIEASLSKVKGLCSALRLLALPPGDEPFEIRSHLENAAALVRETLPEGIRIDLHLDPIPPVRGRAELLGEVWTNLIVNAAQALGRGGTITIEALTAPARGASRTAGAVVRIIDDGPGIPDEVLPRIFEARFTTRATEGGSGLGLPLARSIVERMGGRIEVTSRPGRTCFEVILPAASTTATVGG